MRRSVTTGVLLLVVAFLSMSQNTSALDSEQVVELQPTNGQVAKLLAMDTDTSVVILVKQAATSSLNKQTVAKSKPEEKKSEIKKHTVEENENLTKIADRYQVTWERIFFKNESIKDPNMIEPGTELIIPAAEEELKEREIPKPVPVVVPITSRRSATTTAPAASAPAAATTQGSSDNRYTAGYCTWYVKNKRPDLPNSLGNAATWVSRAAASGYATGSSPRSGAVGQRGNHVVYVESVNADGTVNISEMNHAGLWVTTNRTLPGDYFSYIY